MAWQSALGSTGLGFASNLVQSLQQRDMNLIGTQMAGIMDLARSMNPMVRDLENQAQMAMFQQTQSSPWPNFGVSNWGQQPVYNALPSSPKVLAYKASSANRQEVPTVSYSLKSLFAGFFNSGAGQSVKKGSVLDNVIAASGGGAPAGGSIPVATNRVIVSVSVPIAAVASKPVSAPRSVTAANVIPTTVKVLRFLNGTSQTLMSNGKIYEKDQYGYNQPMVDTTKNKVTYNASGIVESIQFDEDYTGSSILEYADGIQEVKEKNGNLVLKERYGNTILTSNPGDTLVRSSNGRILLNKHFDEKSGTLTTRYADGAAETLSADGVLKFQPPNGYLQTIETLNNSVVRGANGEFIRGIVNNPNSQSETTLFRDGSSESKNKDGQITLKNANFTVAKYIDGKNDTILRNDSGQILSVTTKKEKTEETWFVDNSTESKDANGKISVNYKINSWYDKSYVVDLNTEKVTRGKDGKIIYTESEDADKKTHTKRFLDNDGTTETTDSEGKITISYKNAPYKESKTIDSKKETVVRDDQDKIIATSSTGADAAESKK